MPLLVSLFFNRKLAATMTCYFYLRMVTTFLILMCVVCFMFHVELAVASLWKNWINLLWVIVFLLNYSSATVSSLIWPCSENFYSSTTWLLNLVCLLRIIFFWLSFWNDFLHPSKNNSRWIWNRREKAISVKLSNILLQK